MKLNGKGALTTQADFLQQRHVEAVTILAVFHTSRNLAAALRDRMEGS